MLVKKRPLDIWSLTHACASPAKLFMNGCATFGRISRYFGLKVLMPYSSPFFRGSFLVGLITSQYSSEKYTSKQDTGATHHMTPFKPFKGSF